MPKRKVIQDSDGEDDLDSPVKQAQANNDKEAPDTYPTITQEPVKLQLNDADDLHGSKRSKKASSDAGRLKSSSQPSASTFAGKGPDSSACNDIFEFDGDSDGEELGRKRKKRRTQSQLSDPSGRRSLRNAEEDDYMARKTTTQTSTIPTEANTSPFQVPSLSSFFKEDPPESPRDGKIGSPQALSNSSENPKDSFDDELGAAFASSEQPAESKPMVLVPDHYPDKVPENQDGGHAMQNQGRRKENPKTEGQQANFADELGSDDQAIGVPKDLYRPRPSRSRGRGREDGVLLVPVDFSKRPEAVPRSRQKSKRRKTSGQDNDEDEHAGQMSAHDTMPAFEEQRVDEEADTGEQSEAVTNSVAHDADPTTKPAKKPRGRPKKNADHQKIDSNNVMTDVPDTTLSHVDASVQESTIEARCKKPSSIVNEDSDPEEVEPVRDPEAVLESSGDDGTTPLQETSANSPKKRGRPSKSHETAMPQPETPSKAAAAPSPKGPDKHSPINSTSAVKFRVGLSKRARIEPLLRIVRKP